MNLKSVGLGNAVQLDLLIHFSQMLNISYEETRPLHHEQVSSSSSLAVSCM